MDAETLIAQLNLQPLHEEGGYFRRTYTAAGTIPASALPLHGGERLFSTAIYYLVKAGAGNFSALHCLKSDELFHFYAGDPLHMVQIHPGGEVFRVTLGPDLSKDQSPQTVVPGGVWQGAKLAPGGKWALVGCTVVPGFEYEDYRVGTRAELFPLFPQHRAIIEEFTHE